MKQPRTTQGIPRNWGATQEEISASYPSGVLLPTATNVLFRAVTVTADGAALFRWLCQLKVSSYSFAFMFGMPTPKELTPGLDDLRLRQSFMDLFELVDYEQGRQVTLAISGNGGKAIYGGLVVTYAVRDIGGGRSRLVVRTAHEPRSRLQRLIKPLLNWGDLFMMMRQLSTLKRLAERDRTR